MRVAEILLEFDYLDRLEGDINDLLIAGKAAGVQSIDLRQLVQQLREMGYSVSEDALRAKLEEVEFVTVSGNDISFVGSDDGSGITDVEDQAEVNKDRVANMASKAASKDIKS